MPRVRLFGMITNPLITDSAVSLEKLKTTTHEQSTTQDTWQAKVLTYADYGFECQIKGCVSADCIFKRADETDHPTSSTTSYVGETVYIKSSSLGYSSYVSYRYVTASGEVFWIWILRDKLTKSIISMDVASDHCSFGLPDPSFRPHPFEREYNPAKHEIILINPDRKTLKQMYEKKGERGLIETVTESYEIDEGSNPAWPDVPVTVRIKNDDWMQAWITQKAVKVEKKVIPKVDYVICKSLKKKKE